MTISICHILAISSKLVEYLLWATTSSTEERFFIFHNNLPSLNYCCLIFTNRCIVSHEAAERVPQKLWNPYVSECWNVVVVQSSLNQSLTVLSLRSKLNISLFVKPFTGSFKYANIRLLCKSLLNASNNFLQWWTDVSLSWSLLVLPDRLGRANCRNQSFSESSRPLHQDNANTGRQQKWR